MEKEKKNKDPNGFEFKKDSFVEEIHFDYMEFQVIEED